MPSEEEADSASRRTLLDLLTKRAFQKRHVTLPSGELSDFYIDCKKALTSEGLYCAGQLFCNEIYRRYGRTIEGVGGLTIGANLLTAATCMIARDRWLTDWVPFCVREKLHNVEARLEGPTLNEGARVVILEDTIMTGASALKAIQRTRLCRLNPIFVLALVDRGDENGRSNIEAEGISVHALFTRHDFLV
jgi:orotate phosphoribosyltransferase